MMEKLKNDNIEDYRRRIFQEEVLSLEPKLLSDWDVKVDTSSNLISSLHETINVEDEKSGNLVLNSLYFKACAASLKGYHPDDHERANQDRYDIRINIDNKGTHYLAVYDGHGPGGHHCAEFCKEKIPDLFLSYRGGGGEQRATNQARSSSSRRAMICGCGTSPCVFGTKDALEKAYLDTNVLLVESDEINTELSGTTSTAIVLDKDRLTVSNVGDSVVILGSKNPGSETMTASLLVKPHDLSRLDERARIENSGGLILSAEEYDGLPKSTNSVPRIWYRESSEKLPGCAFTRSLGDEIAQKLGVSARPEFHERRVEKDQVLVIASDGLTDFVDAQTCIDIACQYNDPALASEKLIKAALGGWAKQNDYVDDITVIVVYLLGKER